MKRYYKAVFEPQEEGGFTAIVPSLSGCVSQGDTFNETIANIKEAIAPYIESLGAGGLPVPGKIVFFSKWKQ